MKWFVARVLLVAVLLTAHGFARTSSVSGECNHYNCGDSGDQCTPDAGNNDNCFGFGTFCVAWNDC